MYSPVVLIVDDDPGLLRLFSALVERLGCETLRAPGGVKALDTLDETTPDLLILDLAMPEISGLDVLRHVRRTPRLDSMKVMILTARPNMVREVEALGIDCWVSKPVMPNDFLDAVQGLLNEV
jgi:chemosensory pili system protein ChpA (sensor histidine kinase/response regulator)